ncbi:hypothetical protein D3C87_1600680 [compost metagenome]
MRRITRHLKKRLAAQAYIAFIALKNKRVIHCAAGIQPHVRAVGQHYLPALSRCGLHMAHGKPQGFTLPTFEHIKRRAGRAQDQQPYGRIPQVRRNQRLHRRRSCRGNYPTGERSVHFLYRTPVLAGIGTLNVQLLGNELAQPLFVVTGPKMTKQQCCFVGRAFVFQIALKQRL